MAKARCILASAVVVLAFVVSGCGGNKPIAQNKPLRIWHWMTDREDAFNELAARYQKATGITVRFELYAPSDVYVQKVRSAAQTNGLPDVFGILGETRDIASFIHAGHVLSLEDEMSKDGNAWRSTFYPKTLAVNAFLSDNPQHVPAGIYAAPIDATSIQLLYNKRLLAKLGVKEPPKNWKELLQLGKLSKEQGLLGFVSGWAELWLIDCFATDYAVHLMDMAKVEATYAGKVPYTDPDWIKVFRLFVDLRDSGLLADGIVTMVNKRAEQLFANEQAVFAFNGTWAVNVYRSMNPELDYGVIMLPAIKNRPMVTWGGAGSSFFVNARSARSQEAVAFLKWLTAEEQQRYLLEATQNIPANRAAAKGLSSHLADFASAIDSAIHPRLFAIQERSAVLEAFDKGIQSILIGESTPEQVARQVQTVKERETSRAAQSDNNG